MVSVPVANPFDTAYVDFDPTEPNRLTGSLGHDGVVFIHVQSTGAGDAVSSSSGSGSLLYTGRHILTAAHVLPDDLRVRFETQAFRAKRLTMSITEAA